MDCHEFTVGFCTKEIFQYENCTKTCTKKHNKYARDDYASSEVLLGIENEVLKIYNGILKNVNVRISNNKEIVVRNPHYNRLLSLLQDNTDVRYYRLFNKLQDKVVYQPMCSKCGAYMQGEECKHFLHQCYVDLRNNAKKLSQKIRDAEKRQ